MRSELYEVLALLERASVSKEREGEVVNRGREKGLMNKMQQSITITADTPKPPRATSSRAAAAVAVVPAHESSVLLDDREDSLITADIQSEHSPPSRPPPPPLEEIVLETGDVG